MLILVMTHFSATLVLYLLQLPLAVFVLSIIIMLGSMWRSLRYHVFYQAHDAIAGVVFLGDDEWLLKNTAGDEYEACLCRETFSRSWLVILCFRLTQGGKRFAVLLPDTVAASSMHRLRMHLALS